MRFTILFLSLLAGTASIVHAFPAPESFTEAELLLRADGDVSTLTARSADDSMLEIVERDTAFAAATGADSLTARGLPAFDETEVEELVLRSLGLDEGTDFEVRDVADFADALEARYAKIVMEVGKQVVKGIIKIVEVIKGKIEKDKARRGQFTSDFIKDARAKYPNYNWVICHTKHKTHFQGESHHRHQEFKVSFGKTIGYEIYWFKKGTFERIGDGGYLNWSYGGNIASKSKDGKKITFK